MHILVCIKQVIDQEIPPRAFRINRAERRPDVPGAALVMSIFDANALEVALKLRDASGPGSSVTALSVGPPSAEEVLRKALAVTAGRAILLTGGLLTLDPPTVAAAIAAAVRRLAAEGAPADLILTGRQAGDWEHGQTGGMIAEALDWPCLTFVSRLAPAEQGVRARREVEDGYETILARTPFVATVTNDETNQLRLAKVRDVMQAHRRPLTRWGAADVDLHAPMLQQRTEVLDLFIPEQESSCEIIEGETPAGRGRALGLRLRELRIL